MITLNERAWTASLFGLTSISVISALFYNGRHAEFYTLTGILGLITATIFFVRARRCRLDFGLPGVFLFALFGWSALAISWSHIPYSSVMDLGALASCVVFYIIWRLVPGNVRNEKTQWYLIIGGLLYALVMIGQALLEFSPTGSLVNPNSSAGFLNLLWPAAAIVYLKSLARKRAAVTLGTVFVILTAMNLPGSRGALLGAAVALLILMAFAMHYYRAHGRAATLLCVFVLAVLLAEMLYGGILSGLERMSSPTLEGTSRFTIWNASWDMIREHPWIGFGPGVFWLAYDAYRLPTDGSSGFYAHNDYLQFWIERGLPGLVLLLAIGVACCWAFYRTLRPSSRENSTRLPPPEITVTSIAALAATAAHSLVSFSLHLLPFLVVCGIHVARVDNFGGPRWTIAIPDFRNSIIAKACLLLVAIPLAHFAMIGTSLAYSEQGSEQVARNEFAGAAASFTTARAIWSLPDVMWYLQANVHVEAIRELGNLSEEQTRRLVTEADQLLDGAEARNPHRSTTHLIRGLLRADHPGLVDGTAVAAFRKALRVDPRNIEARYSLSQVLEREGRLSEALDWVERGLDLRYSGQTDLTPLTRRAETLRSLLSTDAA